VITDFRFQGGKKNCSLFKSSYRWRKGSQTANVHYAGHSKENFQMRGRQRGGPTSPEKGLKVIDPSWPTREDIGF
jgi:hypothetical protein